MGTQSLDLIGGLAEMVLSGVSLEDAADAMGVTVLAKGRRLVEDRLAELRRAAA